MSGGGEKSKAEQGITQTGERVYQAGQLTPQEKAQYEGSFSLGQLIESLMKSEMGLGQRPAGYQTPEQQYLGQAGELGQNLYAQTLSELKDPYAYYESTLQPQLQLVGDLINRNAQQRGLLRSGIPIEQMGRAGVDLAIKEAQGRMAARSQAQAKGSALAQYTEQGAQNRLANLGNLYSTQQSLGGGAMNRQAGSASAAGGYWAYPGQASLGDIYGRQAAMYALPGQALGAAGMALGGGMNPLASLSNSAIRGVAQPGLTQFNPYLGF